MRLLTVMFALGMGLAGTTFAAEKVAKVDTVTTTAPESVGEMSIQDRTRRLAINSRKRKSQDQFNNLLEKNYPHSYRMVKALPATEQEAVFDSYKAGDSMNDIRRSVVEKYSKVQK
ncbi:MAG: hypothetical protein ACWA5Q_09845 [bacterium]